MTKFFEEIANNKLNIIGDVSDFWFGDKDADFFISLSKKRV